MNCTLTNVLVIVSILQKKWGRVLMQNRCAVFHKNFLSASNFKLQEMAGSGANGASLCKLFKGKKDRYNGIIVNSAEEPCNCESFSSVLEASLTSWRNSNVRTVWFTVGLGQAEWIPILAKNGFKFHRAKDDDVVMYKWLPVSEESNIPPYAHTMVGVGAVVINSVGELLVVRERFPRITQWKLPGGYVEPGENIGDAAVREVFEETHVRTEFLNLISFRHMHNANFGCSDIYFIAQLKPLSNEIEKCEREIEAAQWMKVEEFVNHPKVHDGNKFFVKKCIEYREEGKSIGCVQNLHPVINKPQCVYSIMSNENIPQYKSQVNS